MCIVVWCVWLCLLRMSDVESGCSLSLFCSLLLCFCETRMTNCFLGNKTEKEKPLSKQEIDTNTQSCPPAGCRSIRNSNSRLGGNDLSYWNFLLPPLIIE